MRHIIIYITAISFLLLSFIACSDDDKTGNILNITKTELFFDTDGGTGFLEINSTEAFKAEGNKDWFTVSAEGQKVIVNVSEYNENESRTGTITITSGELSKVAAVYQIGGSLYLETTQIMHDFSKASTLSSKIKNKYTSDVEIVTFLKNEKDKNLATPYIKGDTLLIDLKKGSSLKMKNIDIYIGIKSKNGSIILKDSLQIGTFLTKENIIGKWEAKFYNNGGKLFTNEVEIVKVENSVDETRFFIKGITAYEPGTGHDNHLHPIEIPLTFVGYPDSHFTFDITLDKYVLKESYERFIYLTLYDSKTTNYWHPSSSTNYKGKINYNAEDKIEVVFPSSTYAGKAYNGFSTRAYSSATTANNTTQEGRLRTIANLTLTKK